MNDQPPIPDPAAPAAADASSPGLAEILPATLRGQSAILAGIFVLLLVYPLYFAREVLAPILLALMLSMLLSPLVARLKRLRLPEPLGAALVLAVLLGGLGWGGYLLSGPAAEWISRVPESLVEIQDKVRSLKRPMQQASQVGKTVEELTKVSPTEPPKVKVQETTWSEFFVINAGQLVAQTLVLVILLYFLLASGDLFMRRYVKILSTGREKRRAVEIARAMRREVGIYLATVTMINAGLGACTAIAMATIGMPSPVLWGVLAGFLNFMPYVGASLTLVVLTLVGMLTYKSIGQAFLPPLIFLILTNIEANLITPYLLGRNLTLNPAIVFVAIVIWGWMWGVPGAFLAVPLLVALKVFSERIDALHGVAVMLGRRDSV